MGEDGTTLIARQVQLGPGSWTLASPARAGGQFNSRGPLPFGKSCGKQQEQQGAGCRVQGRLDLNCWATLSLFDEAFHPISLFPPDEALGLNLS